MNHSLDEIVDALLAARTREDRLTLAGWYVLCVYLAMLNFGAIRYIVSLF